MYQLFPCLFGCALVTGVGAVFNTARLTPGSIVAVLGCGGVGLSIIQGARIAGARRIVAVDLKLIAFDAASGTVAWSRNNTGYNHMYSTDDGGVVLDGSFFFDTAANASSPSAAQGGSPSRPSAG